MLRHRFLFSAALLACAGFATTAHGQPAPAAPPVETAAAEVDAVEAPALTADVGVTAEQLEQLVQQAEQTPELDEETRKQAVEAYRAALAQLQLATDSAARRNAFASEATTVTERVQLFKQQLEELKSKEPPALDPGVTLADLEQSVAKAELTLATRKTNQAAAEAAPQVRAQRRKDIRARMAAVQERLVALSGPPPVAAAPVVSAALATKQRVEQVALQYEAPALEAELAKFDAEDAADLVRLQSDLTARQTAYTERRLQRLKEELKKARERAAADAVRKARLEAIVAVPVLRLHAERNQQLAETTQRIRKELAQAEKDLKSSQDAHDQISRQFKQAQQKVDTVKLTSSVGAMLRKQRANLPDVAERRAAVAGRSEVIDEAQYQKLEYDDERQELADTDACVAAILEEAGHSEGQASTFLEESAHELLDRKRAYLDDLIHAYNQYFDTLFELDATDQQVITLTGTYENYIDERVLWIRSGRMLTRDLGFSPSDAWIVNPARWMEVGERLWADLRANPWPYGIFACLFGFLLFRGVRLRRQLNESGDTAAKANCRTFEPTLRAVALTVLISAPWPGVVALLAWRLNAAAGDSEFANAVSHGLASLCLLWAPLELARHLCRPRGLGESHFDWPETITQSLRRRLRWLTLLGLPFAFVTATLYASDPTHGRDTLERLCFLVGVALLAVMLFRMLRPTDMLREHLAYHPGGWLNRFSPAWPWLGATAPLALAGLAFAGYYYTAQVLSWRLFATCCLLTALVVSRDLLLRMLLLRRRNLSMQQAKERAAAAAAAAESTEAGNNVAGIIAATPQSNLSDHNQQTRRLVSTAFTAASVVGLWLIWVQVLPALGMLDKYPLWRTAPEAAAVAVATPSPTPMMGVDQPAPEPAVAQASGKEVVTLSDLGLAILVTIITYVLFRNGPGLLEISLLQKLGMDPSKRYAVTTIASYVIVLVGTVTACSTIGLRWSQIQWLATALTFGLAFGLQEMFANFVAGLILLLERPIRVGDVVTVDDITGVVSKIRIRATSITNWDRKEYVVPNKEFITGRLLNWTLSDKVNRVVVNVGVAYGTDTDRTRELLLQVANEHPLVLKDPPAVATFEGFGDNSLNFVLRTYLATLDNRLDVIHELHTRINKAFAAEKIEIAFPQRDLHIRTAPAALAVALNGGTSGSEIGDDEGASSDDASRDAA